MIYIVRYTSPYFRDELAWLEAENWNKALENATQNIDELNKKTENGYALTSVQKIDTLKNWSK